MEKQLCNVSVHRRNKMKNKAITGYIYSGLPYMVLFAGYFIWFAFVADYILFFQEKSTLFIFSGEYFSGKSGRPGGLLVCLSEFLTSFYFIPVAGAFIISAINTLTAFLVSRCVLALSGRNEKIYPFVISLLFFVAQTDYTFLLHNSLGMFLSVMIFCITVKTSKHLKGWLPVIIAPFWYFIVGGFCWIFMITLVFYFLLFGSRSFLKICVLAGVMTSVFLVSASFLFFESTGTLLFHPLVLPDSSLTKMLFLLVLGLVALLPAIATLKFPVPNFLSATYVSESILRTLIILSVMVLIGAYQFDKKNNHYFHVEKLFYDEKFAEIIDYNTRNPSANSLTLFSNNLALAETGLLNDRLFHFLQSNDGRTLFLKWEMMTEMLKRGGYFYYTIGMINEAHRWAFENMVMTGHTPEGLKMLVRTELINGNYSIAAKYISLLRRTLFYRKDALHYEKFLFNDDALESDPELGHRRSNRIRTDFFSITDDPFVNVERIVTNDTINRTAFEYDIAFRLLRKDYQGLTSCLWRFEKLGYKSFPDHVEEAILAISTMDNGVMPETGSLHVSPLTQERWTQFLTVFQQYGNDPRAAEPALRKQFGNTFWYWAFYR